MATKYCEKHDIWYDYKEGGCPECMKIPRIAADIVSTVVVGTIGGLILGGKKIHEKLKESETSSGNKSDSSGCYIATACYGSYDCPQVLTFRNFRDTYLAQTMLGKMFIKIYYALSPKIAERLKNKNRINAFIRIHLLDRIYQSLRKKF